MNMLIFFLLIKNWLINDSIENLYIRIIFFFVILIIYLMIRDENVEMFMK